MASTTRSSITASSRPAWLVPLLVFGGVAGSVSASGSILMFVLSLFGGASAESSTQTAVPQQSSANSSDANPPQVTASLPSSASSSPAPSSSGSTSHAGQKSALPGAEGNQPAAVDAVPQPAQAEVAKADLPPPAIDVSGLMKPKAKRIEIGSLAVIDLPGDARSFALDPVGGRLAIVGPWEGSIAFLKAEDLNAGGAVQPETVKMIGEPESVVYAAAKSSGLFVIGTREPDGITFLDAQTLKQVKHLQLEIGRPQVLATSRNPAATCLYLTFLKSGGTPHDGLGLARINLERLEIDGIWIDRQHQFRHVSMSPDGAFIYTLPNNSGDKLTRSRLPRAEAKPLNTAPATNGPQTANRGGGDGWETVTSDLGRVATRYSIDPRGAFIAAGLNIYSADITQLLMELDYDPLAFFAKKPWMAGLRMYQVVVGSTNDGRAVAEISLPEEYLIPDEKNRRPQHLSQTAIHPASFAQFLADESRDRFLVGTRRHVVTVPLEKLDLPAEPDLALAETPLRRAIVDRSYTTSLSTISGSPQIKLVKAPEGMAVEDGVLHWTPQDNDVGFLDVRVELKDGRVRHDEAWQIEVGQQQLELPFLAEGCAPASDGTRAVVWGIDRSHVGTRDLHESQIALVDLETQTILTSRKLDFRIARLEFGKHAVYAAEQLQPSAPKPTLHRLALNDLRDLQELELDRAFLTTVADRLLICFDGRRNFSRYSLPDLKPLETPINSYGSVASAAPVPRRLADGWLLDGVIWDDTLEKARWLIEPDGYERDSSASNDSSIQAIRGLAYVGPAATRNPRNDDLLSYDDSPHIPARLKLRKTMPDMRTTRGPQSGRIHLDFVGLESIHPVRSVTLRNGHWQKEPRPAASHVVTTPKHVLVTHYGDVFIIPIAGRDGPIPIPFRIEPQQSTFVLSTTRPTRVKYEAPGAAKFELTLHQIGSHPPQKLESASGEFELDLRQSIPELVKVVGAMIHGNGRYDEQGKNRYEGYAIAMRDSFRKIVGKNPAGLPLLVKAEIAAYDANGAMVRLPHSYLVDIPEKEFEQSRPSSPSSRVARSANPSPRPQPSKARTVTPKKSVATTPEKERDKQTVQAYSQAFRQRIGGSNQDLDLERLKAEVLAVDAKAFAMLQSAPSTTSEVRTWTDTQGRTMRARFDRVEADVVVATGDGNRTFRIPLGRLSDADREWVRSQASNAVADQAQGGPAGSLRALAVAVQKHHDVTGSYPPKALVTDDGAPLLSWRVLLLSQLGYDSLAAAFRYDEPWNSDHNRQLIPLIPAVFRADPELAANGKTPYVAVISPTGMISDRFATRISEVKDPAHQTLLFTEVLPSFAPVWTQPSDPPVNSSGKFDQILRFRADRVLLSFADASVASLPIGTAETEWKKLVSIQDGMTIEAAMEPVPRSTTP